MVIGNFDAAGVAVMPDEADAPHEFIRQIIIHMKLTWDEAKRQVTLAHRGLDFADAALVFSGPVVEWEDGMRKVNEREQTRFGQ